MNDAVFIADLHLNALDTEITKRFYDFCAWAKTNTRSLYILGDFFHVWPGDDSLDNFSRNIALQLADLSTGGIKIYFLPGNRDFLIGKKYADLAKMTMLQEPTMITLQNEPILLVHGDRFCTKDKAHQWLRRITRNKIFVNFFLLFPLSLRNKIVGKIRTYSKKNNQKPVEKLAITASCMLKFMYNKNVNILIHGHIHKPGLIEHNYKNNLYKQYVVSDWDQDPTILCHNKENGFYFYRFISDEGV